MSTSQNNASFIITPAAIKRIAHLLVGEPTGTSFTVSVQGGGCSGFQYHFDFATKPLEDGDLLIEENGARVHVDGVALGMLEGSSLDYTEDLSGAGFAIKNPNATAKCGCGNSFSVM